MVPKGRKEWQAVNNLTWTSSVLNFLRQLEEKRAAALEEAGEDLPEPSPKESPAPSPTPGQMGGEGVEKMEEEEDKGDDPDYKDEESTKEKAAEEEEESRDMLYYGPEMAALEKEAVTQLPRENKVQAVVLLTVQF